MEPSLRAELDTLRSRAYGRSADVALDSDSVRRLQELEALARQGRQTPLDEPAATTQPFAPSDDVSSVSSSTTTSLTQPSDASAQVPTPERDLGRRPRRKPDRLVFALWAISVAASAALAATATAVVVGILPVAVSSGAPQIATLEPDSAVVVPVGFFGAGASSATYEFHGLTLFETPSNVFGNGNGGGDCFVITLSSDIPEDDENDQGGYSTSGPFYSACRIGNFPAAITIPVDSSSPPELRTQFPDGALQFIKDGDRIGVFLGRS